MDIGSADRLDLQDLQISEHSTIRTLPERAASTNSQYPLKREGTQGNRGTHRQPQSLHLLLRSFTLVSSFQSRGIHLVEVKYCRDTRPKNGFEIYKKEKEKEKEKEKG
eukprot:228176-Pelagomonas_calceolata.AAC.1